MRSAGKGVSAPPLRGLGYCYRAGKSRMTKSEAKSTAKQDERRTGLNIQAYKCPFCPNWHVGGRRW